MCLMSMALPKRLENLPPFGMVTADGVAERTRMPCVFRPQLRLDMFADLIERHWADHLADTPSCSPVLMLHVAWNNIDQAGIYSIAVGNGHDSLTSYTDDGMIECPAPYWKTEAKIAKEFISQILPRVFVTEIAAYTTLMDGWKEQLDTWHGADYSGQTAFFIPLRDPNMVFVKEDRMRLTPALVFTDLSQSNHSLLKAQERAKSLPSGILSWCPKNSVINGEIGLYRAT